MSGPVEVFKGLWQKDNLNKSFLLTAGVAVLAACDVFIERGHLLSELLGFYEYDSINYTRVDVQWNEHYGFQREDIQTTRLLPTKHPVDAPTSLGLILLANATVLAGIAGARTMTRTQKS